MNWESVKFIDPYLGFNQKIKPTFTADDNLKLHKEWKLKGPEFPGGLTKAWELQDPNSYIIMLTGGCSPAQTAAQHSSKNIESTGVVNLYHPARNTWKEYGIMPEPRCYHAAAYLRGYVYVTGGNNPMLQVCEGLQATNTTFRFCLRSKKWLRRANMKFHRSAHAMAATPEAIFVFGGRDEKGSILPTVEKYTAASDEWSMVRQMPEPRMGMGCTICMDLIWIIGGVTYECSAPRQGVPTGGMHVFLRRVCCYNPVKNVWFEKPPLKEARAFCAAGTVYKYVTVIGGLTMPARGGEPFSTNHIDIFNYKNQKWERRESLRTPKHGMACAKAKHSIFVFGGLSAIEGQMASVSETDAYDILLDEVQNLASVPGSLTGSAAVTLPKEVNYSDDAVPELKKEANNDGDIVSSMRLRGGGVGGGGGGAGGAGGGAGTFGRKLRRMNVKEKEVTEAPITDPKQCEEKFMEQIERIKQTIASRRQFTSNPEYLNRRGMRDLKLDARYGSIGHIKEVHLPKSGRFKHNKACDKPLRTELSQEEAAYRITEYPRLSVMDSDPDFNIRTRKCDVGADVIGGARALAIAEAEASGSQTVLSARTGGGAGARTGSATGIMRTGSGTGIGRTRTKTRVQFESTEGEESPHRLRSLQLTSMADDVERLRQVTIPSWPMPALPSSSVISPIDCEKITSAEKLNEWLRRYVPFNTATDPNLGTISFLDNLFNLHKRILGLRVVHEKPIFAQELKHIADLRHDTLPMVVVFGGLLPKDPLCPNIGRCVLRYHILKDRWEYYGLMPEPRSHHAVAYDDGVIYVTGGYDPHVRDRGEIVASRSVFALDVRSGKWAQRADMHCARAHHGMVVFDGMIYCIGGRDHRGRVLSSVEMYDPQNDKWTKTSPLIEPMMGMGAVVYDGQIWSIGGITATPENPEEHHTSAMVMCLDSGTGSWTQRGSLREPRGYVSACVLKDQIWLCGGCYKHHWTDDDDGPRFMDSMDLIETYDAETDQWTRYKSSLTSARHCYALVPVADCCFYAIGGMSSQELGPLPRPELYVPDTDTFHLPATLPLALTGMAGLSLPPYMATYRSVSLMDMILYKVGYPMALLPRRRVDACKTFQAIRLERCPEYTPDIVVPIHKSYL